MLLRSKLYVLAIETTVLAIISVCSCYQIYLFLVSNLYVLAIKSLCSCYQVCMFLLSNLYVPAIKSLCFYFGIYMFVLSNLFVLAVKSKCSCFCSYLLKNIYPITYLYVLQSLWRRLVPLIFTGLAFLSAPSALVAEGLVIHQHVHRPVSSKQILPSPEKRGNYSPPLSSNLQR